MQYQVIKREDGEMSERMYYSRDAEMRAQRERLTIAVVSTLLGAGVATLLALIFAPRRGDETRRELGKQVEQVVTQGRKTANHIIDEVEDHLDSVRK
jgi:hypothetical protein